MLPMNETTRTRASKLPPGVYALAMVETVTTLDGGRRGQFILVLDGYGLHFCLEGDAMERDLDRAAIARMIQALHPRISIHIYRDGTAYDMLTGDGYEEVRAQMAGSSGLRYYLRPGEGQLFMMRAALPAHHATESEVDARYERLASECRRLIKLQMEA